VPELDDHQFENYLKRFRPLAAEPFQPVVNRRRVRRPLVFSACAAITAVVAVAVFMTHSHKRQPRAPHRIAAMGRIRQLATQHPLTVGSANELLSHARSFKAALGGLAIQRPTPRLPRGTRSALAVLGEEDFKL
jgi:hypothetical protein